MVDPDFDGACCVCNEAEADHDNPLVYCECCGLGVHAQCYGYPLTINIPENEWICVSCMANISQTVNLDADQPVSPTPSQSSSQSDQSINPSNNQVQCSLCPGGTVSMLKRCMDGTWCHLSCAIWIPEVFFRLPDGNDAVDTSRIPRRRFHRICEYCNSSSGACMDCSSEGCGRWFHITCGFQREISLEYRATSKRGETDLVLAFCDRHTKKYSAPTKKKRGSGRTKQND